MPLYWAAPFQGCPVINSVFGRLWRKTVPWGREGTRVWYRETMFSQMVSYDFPLHRPLHEYFLYLVSSPPPQKPRRRCEPEEDYLRCSKRFYYRSHSTIFLLFELKSVDDVGAGKLREMLTLHTNRHAVHGRFTLASSQYSVFPGPLGQCISVTFPRRTAGRRLDNLGVRMREHFCIFEKFTRSTEIIYK